MRLPLGWGLAQELVLIGEYGILPTAKFSVIRLVGPVGYGQKDAQRFYDLRIQ